jgi:hypothetical protein
MKRDPTTARLVKRISTGKGIKLRNIMGKVLGISRVRPRTIRRAARTFYELYSKRNDPTAK